MYPLAAFSAFYGAEWAIGRIHAGIAVCASPERFNRHYCDETTCLTPKAMLIADAAKITHTAEYCGWVKPPVHVRMWNATQPARIWLAGAFEPYPKYWDTEVRNETS